MIEKRRQVAQARDQRILSEEEFAMRTARIRTSRSNVVVR